MSAAGNNNIDDNTNIIFIIRDTKLHVPVVTLSVKYNQQLSNLLHKESERSVYWNEKKKKKKSENANMTNESRYFLESNLVAVNRSFFLIYSNNDKNFERFKFRDITYHKVQSKILSSSMEKTFMTKQLIQI